jgi:hypothetical protein
MATHPVALNLDGLQVFAGDRKDIPEWFRNNHDWHNPVDVKKLEVNVYIQFLAGSKIQTQGGLYRKWCTYNINVVVAFEYLVCGQ